MTNSLENKVVLITGASSGFGADAARLFAKEGAVVVLAARRIDRLQDLAEQIRTDGGTALVIPVDVANRHEIEVMMQTVFDIYGDVDILFNNAGFGRLDWLENLDTERDIETQVDVNLLGLIQITRAVLPYMLARRRGHIINMSSVAGWIAAPTYTVYAATKFGIRGFTDALRREVASFGIKVSGIYPGAAITEFGEHTGDSEIKKMRLPAWVFMPSGYVARKVIEVARRPRRTLILPWWFNILIWLTETFPTITDWIVSAATRKYHTMRNIRPASEEAETVPQKK
jgi:uncharacterized protein